MGHSSLLWLLEGAAGLGHQRFDYLPPAWAAPTVRYGPPGDASKLLLDVSALRESSAPCIIYSLGGNMQTEFEEAMLLSTACRVNTFDCTVSEDLMANAIARAPQSKGRFFFFPFCVGVQGTAAVIKGKTTTLRSVSSIMGELGHSRLDLLKMDVEGGEHTALPAFVHDLAAGTLPAQVSFELHWMGENSAVELWDTLAAVRALVDAGYVLYSREDNPLCGGGCTELSMVKGCDATY